jgi:hypothetical protein
MSNLLEQVRTMRLIATRLVDMADSLVTQLELSDSSDSNYESSNDEEIGKMLPMTTPTLVRQITYLSAIDLDQVVIERPGTPEMLSPPPLPAKEYKKLSFDD